MCIVAKTNGNLKECQWITYSEHWQLLCFLLPWVLVKLKLRHTKCIESLKKNVLLKLNINNKRRTHIKNVHITFSKYNKVLGWLNVKCNKNVFRVDFNGKLEWLIYWTKWKYGRTIDGLTQHLFAFTRIYTSNHNCYI